MNLFKGKIYCLQCGRRYNYKPDNGSHIYICSTYKNYGTCKRNMIKESDLINIITKHIHIKEPNRVQISIEEIPSLVGRIEVLHEHITIYYVDGSKSEWCGIKLAF